MTATRRNPGNWLVHSHTRGDNGDGVSGSFSAYLFQGFGRWKDLRRFIPTYEQALEIDSLS